MLTKIPCVVRRSQKTFLYPPYERAQWRPSLTPPRAKRSCCFSHTEKPQLRFFMLHFFIFSMTSKCHFITLCSVMLLTTLWLTLASAPSESETPSRHVISQHVWRRCGRQRKGLTRATCETSVVWKLCENVAKLAAWANVSHTFLINTTTRLWPPLP